MGWPSGNLDRTGMSGVCSAVPDPFFYTASSCFPPVQSEATTYVVDTTPGIQAMTLF